MNFLIISISIWIIPTIIIKIASMLNIVKDPYLIEVFFWTLGVIFFLIYIITGN